MSRIQSNVSKGIAVLMLLYHHLFYSPKSYEMFNVDFLLVDSLAIRAARLFKLCVYIFVFITAYGITKQFSLKNINTGKKISAYTASRYFKLLMPYWFVFVIAQIAGLFLGRSLFAVYGKSLDGMLYLGIDFLGLADLNGTPTYNATWWYMSLAIIQIFVLPLIIALVRKFQGSFVVFSVIALIIAAPNSSDYFVAFFPMVLGVYFALNDYFEKFNEKLKAGKILFKVLITALLCVAFCALYLFVVLFGYRYIVFGLMAVVVCLFSMVISYIPVVSKAFEFIGQRSMTVFLTHTFIYCYFCKDFIYSFKYAPIIFAVLLLSSLMLAFLIDMLRKWTGYDKLTDKIANKFTENLKV